MKYFGSGWAPETQLWLTRFLFRQPAHGRTASAATIPVPIGRPCENCGRPFIDSDLGVEFTDIIPDDANVSLHPRYFHRDCWLGFFALAIHETHRQRVLSSARRAVQTRDPDALLNARAELLALVDEIGLSGAREDGDWPEINTLLHAIDERLNK